MHLNSKYATSQNLNFYSEFNVYPLVVPSAFTLDVYSVQHLTLKATMDKMYSMNDTLNRRSNMSSPKKENMLHSVFNAFNMIWERFSKVPASLITGNHPLSVTVVHNEGIISHEFFKDLTTKKETLSTDDVYIQDAQIKKSLNIIENINHDIFNEKKPYGSRIFNETVKENLNFNYKYIDNKNDDIRSNKKESAIKENVRSNTISCNYLLPIEESNEKSKEELFQHIRSDINAHETHIIKDYHNYEGTCTVSTPKKEQVSTCIDDSTNDKTVVDKELFLSTYSSSIVSIESSKQTTVSNILTNMWQKVCGSVTDRFCRTDPIESDITMKQSLSPKQRRKLNTIAKGRGRGRARSQLRRSGVSQTRHRKERTKHDLPLDIQDDLKSWQEYEMYPIENKESEDCFRLDEDMIDGVKSPVKYTFADVKPKVQKPKTRKTVDQEISKYSTRMRCIPECTEEINVFHEDCVESRYNFQRKTFRPRLMSESSIDSEDSYCIVFESESEITHTSDLEDTNKSDIDQTSEDEESVSPVQKVKFNLNPVVHIMVQWHYAYRAARRGPWEEMARDRVRFKGRINCIEHVLNPILTVQHRTHIWQERFALTE